MDAKDSASVGDESETQILANEASLLFQGRRFGECVDVLTQLIQKKQGDLKVLHNIIVAKYFRDGCYDPKKLLVELNKIKVRSMELAHVSVGQKENASGTENNAVFGSKVNGATPQQISVLNIGRIFCTNEFDTSVVMLNTAIVLFQLHEYAQAMAVLEPLYQNIGPIAEKTAIHVCLLLLDVALACGNPSKAADVIHYLEKYFGVYHSTNHGDNVNTASCYPNQVLKVSGSSHAPALDASGSESNGNANIPDNSLTIALPDETLEYETLYSTLDSGSQNLRRPVLNDTSKLSSDQMASIDLKPNLHLYKVQLLLFMRNLKSAKREIKFAMNIARSGDSSTALLLKSQLEFVRGNHRKAFKLLLMSGNRTEPETLSIFNNNMGCIYHQLGKHHTATMFFSKALNSGKPLWSEKPLKLTTFSQDKSRVILYNCGLQYLLCGKPLIAAHCFNKARPVYFDRPILWLRFAECCLSALEKGALKATGAITSTSEEVRVHIAGSGRVRHLVVDDINSKYKYLDCLEEDGVITTDGQYRLSLPFARRCLLNALRLLDNYVYCSSISRKEDNSNQTTVADTKVASAAANSLPGSTNGDSKESKGSMNMNTTFQSSLSAYEEKCKKERNIIKQAVLADLSYIELSLGNAGKALSAANALKDLPDCSKIYIFLSNVYAAEALCSLNRPKEAIDCLSVYFSDKNGVQLPYSEEDTVKWKMDPAADCDESGPLTAKTSSEEYQDMKYLKPAEARGILYVNLATMSALQGNLEQSSRLLKEALSILPNNPRATLAVIYIHLLSGRKQDALVKLKQCRLVKLFSAHALSSNA